jgi:hypothetical protein
VKIQKLGIVLDESELVELEAILLDQDPEAAFQFVKRLAKKIEIQQRQQCGSPLVKGESAK